MAADVPTPNRDSLEHSHAPADIARRLAKPAKRSYLRDAIYGAIDGAVTTFAIVSGVSGASLAPEIVIILGIANLVGDGFSMAAANFLGTRAENQHIERLRTIERKHIAECPEGEQEEIRQILKSQGYDGEVLESMVEQITSHEEQWLRTMLQYEYGVTSDPTPPTPAALTTFVSFVVVGAMPLLPFVAQWLFGWAEFNAFGTSTVLTAIAFFAVGAAKSRYADQNWLLSALETLAVGATAAGLAYLCGYALRGIGG